MNIEKEYYEIEDFWIPNNIKEADIIRVKTISELIPNDVKTVLDVGCGNGIFLNYLLSSERCFSRLHGLDRSEAALKHVETKTTAASIDDIPFAENEFDLVTSLECIEHLPVKIYEKGLSELCRVAQRYIIISVPNEENLERNLIKCPCCFSSFSSCYHMRSFNEVLMKSLLKQYGFKCIRVETIGVGYNYYFLSDYLKQRNKQNSLSFPIPCPVCGYYLPSFSKKGRGKSNNVLRDLFKKFWPKKNAKPWIVGVYSKNE